MNFLAHLYLSDGTPDSMFGNMLADFVKGRAVDELRPALRRAVMEHRRVDVYTDKHPVFRRSANRIRPRWGKFSAVLMDVFYDHFLAAEWNAYHDTPLRSYIDGVHACYREQREQLPQGMVAAMDRLIVSDRLMSYTTVEGIGLALEKMSLAFRRPTVLAPAAEELRLQHAELREDFHEFFPGLIAYVDELRRSDDSLESSSVLSA